MQFIVGRAGGGAARERRFVYERGILNLRVFIRKRSLTPSRRWCVMEQDGASHKAQKYLLTRRLGRDTRYVRYIGCSSCRNHDERACYLRASTIHYVLRV